MQAYFIFKITSHFNIRTLKTQAGNRQIPMTEDVETIFLEEHRCQEVNNLQLQKNLQ